MLLIAYPDALKGKIKIYESLHFLCIINFYESLRRWFRLPVLLISSILCNLTLNCMHGFPLFMIHCRTMHQDLHLFCWWFSKILSEIVWTRLNSLYYRGIGQNIFPMVSFSHTYSEEWNWQTLNQSTRLKSILFCHFRF